MDYIFSYNISQHLPVSPTFANSVQLMYVESSQ